MSVGNSKIWITDRIVHRKFKKLNYQRKCPSEMQNIHRKSSLNQNIKPFPPQFPFLFSLSLLSLSLARSPPSPPPSPPTTNAPHHLLFSMAFYLFPPSLYLCSSSCARGPRGSASASSESMADLLFLRDGYIFFLSCKLEAWWRRRREAGLRRRCDDSERRWHTEYGDWRKKKVAGVKIKIKKFNIKNIKKLI